MATSESKLHIDAPELLTGSQRARDTLMTAAMWLVYLYLWVPLLSLVAWLLGLELAYDVMIRSGGARDLGSVLIVYLVIIVVIFCGVTTWSLTNRYRFGHLHRRKAQRQVSDAEMSQYFGVAAGMLDTLRSARRVRVDVDEQGGIAVAVDSE